MHTFTNYPVGEPVKTGYPNTVVSNIQPMFLFLRTTRQCIMETNNHTHDCTDSIRLAAHCVVEKCTEVESVLGTYQRMTAKLSMRIAKILNTDANV